MTAGLLPSEENVFVSLPAPAAGFSDIFVESRHSLLEFRRFLTLVRDFDTLSPPDRRQSSCLRRRDLLHSRL